MEKSAEAFRTISEVAEILDTPAHVLRFWESRFPQIRPVKRAGGRRYYRPADVALLAGIRRLLHDEGMTIRGVQKILREQGVRHVAGLGGHDPGPAPVEEAEAAEAQAGFAFEETEEPRGEVVPFAREAPRVPSLRAEALPRPPSPVGDRQPAGAPDANPVATATADTPGRIAGAEDAPPAPPDPVVSAAWADRGVESPAAEIEPAAEAVLPPVRQEPASDGEVPVWSPPAPLVPREATGATAGRGPERGALPPAPEPVEPGTMAAPSGAAEHSPPAPEAESDPEGALSWRPALLRALPARALAHRREEVARLRARLIDLQQRLRAEGEEPRG
ncbi:MerR family transcriptional regulator [Cereibacter sphaeroides]|uniref:MerR family transcriptional regulator n=1 Tax=Cereibacter sphaeroides TaxID=1063 RepID=UPI001F1D3C0B|nr:MerR family transcriptional regulator [Cereibacter sphaeroides]MCE6961604.1 MerR family transcriptional regulator [Cereibacter sphaeroides]MCE6968134.1 MerR family transcriptional regulator [Cereibacter sphaeroides]MCE6974954.1 MerR family transcriptional regulator [Cereibacter sphaeroides]